MIAPLCGSVGLMCVDFSIQTIKHSSEPLSISAAEHLEEEQVMTSVKCEQCDARISRWSLRKEAYILQDQDGMRRYFCSTVCVDKWCNDRIAEGCAITRFTSTSVSGAQVGPFGESEYIPEGAGNVAQIPAARFTCPGCGERAAAKNASLCPCCGHLVHHDCARKSFVTWSCPICNVGLVGQT